MYSVHINSNGGICNQHMYVKRIRKKNWQMATSKEKKKQKEILYIIQFDRLKIQKKYFDVSQYGYAIELKKNLI